MHLRSWNAYKASEANEWTLEKLKRRDRDIIDNMNVSMIDTQEEEISVWQAVASLQELKFSWTQNLVVTHFQL